MAAFTTVTKLVEIPAPAGGEGLKFAVGTAVSSASYDTGGSVIDLSGTFASKVYGAVFLVNNASFRYTFVPTSSTYAAATGKVFVDDNAGTQASSTDDHSSTPGSVIWLAWGTDA
jgi:hypothetical protein